MALSYIMKRGESRGSRVENGGQMGSWSAARRQESLPGSVGRKGINDTLRDCVQIKILGGVDRLNEGNETDIP